MSGFKTSKHSEIFISLFLWFFWADAAANIQDLKIL